MGFERLHTAPSTLRSSYQIRLNSLCLTATLYTRHPRAGGDPPGLLTSGSPIGVGDAGCSDTK